MNKKVVSLKKALLFNLGILLCVGVLLFGVELHVATKKEKDILIQKTESMRQSFVDVHYSMDLLQSECDNADISAAKALAYLYDLDGRIEPDQDFLDMFNINAVFYNEEGLNKDDYGYYYDAVADDGTLITTEAYINLFSYAQRHVITEARIVEEALESEDLFIVVNSQDGTVRKYDWLSGSTVENPQISKDDLTENAFQWMNFDGQYYYVSRVYIEEGYTTLFIGISFINILQNLMTAYILIFSLICMVMTVLTVYIYYSSQQIQKNRNNDSYSANKVFQKIVAYTLISVLLLGMSAYYVQSLLNVSVYTMNAKEEIHELQKTHEKAKESEIGLRDYLDYFRTCQARQISHILSTHPELRTSEHLKELSDIYGIEYIMMFDKNGVETVSDSEIEDFVISDDPEDQSYAFNVLKKGVSVFVQEPQKSELTGEYLQYIGVTTRDVNGVRDGFLQIADDEDLISSLTKDIGLSDLVREVVSGSSESAFMIDSNEEIQITPDFDALYSNAIDVGFTEGQLRNHYYGNISVLDEQYIATSTMLDDNYIYIVGRVETVQQGRWMITLATMAISLVTMIAFSLYMRGKEVTEARDYDDLLYVDVETPTSQQKSTINALQRMMIRNIKWQDKRPEEKAVLVARIIIDFLAAFILILLVSGKTSGNDRSIFNFIIGNRWDKGINLFAFTSSMIAVMIVYLTLAVIDSILFLLMNLSSPRNETVIRLIRSFSKYISVIGLIFYALNQFGFDSRSLLASAGLLTLVVGLGARDLITDILAGLFLIFENEFQVGDIIEIDGYKGRVAEIGIRTTRLVSTTQDVKSINNRNLTNIVNKTRRNTFCDVIVNVPFDENIDEIVAVLNAELPLLKERCPYILNGPTYGGIDDLGGRTMRLSIRTECYELHKFEVRTFVNYELKKMFEEHGFKMI